MFQFQHIDYLYTLAIIPLLVILFISIIYWRRKKLQKLGDEALISEQIQGYIPGRNTFRFILMAIALSSIIIGWANLRMGDKTEKAERKGVDVVIALDVSKSMLAKDLQPDRLTRAKQLIMRLTDKMKNDRVALIVFAGKSYMQVPLTIDYSSVKMILQNVSPDIVPSQGTVISDAINMGMESFARNERKYKSLIVISDGEDHDEKAEDAARQAASEGVIIHTVGVGSPQGSTLFDPDTKSVKLDENGNPVISKLNEEALKSISREGRGTYSYLQNTDEVAERLNSALESMEQKNLGSLMFTDFTSYFQYFLLVGFILLIVEWAIPGAKKKGKSKTNSIISRLGIVLLLLTIGSAAEAQVTRNIQQGNSLYGQQKYKEAAADYEKVVAKNPNYAPGLYNLGTTLYQQKKYDSSRKWLEKTEKIATDKNSKSAANYNIGNTYMSQQKWEEAVNAYKRTLRNNPQDGDAKYNLSYAEQMLKKQQQENKDKKDKQDKKDDKKDQKDKQDKQDKKDDKKDDKKEDKDKQDQDKKDDKKEDQQPQSQPSKLSQQQAEQLLNALQQEEKKLQDKMKKEKGVPVKMQKDW